MIVRLLPSLFLLFALLSASRTARAARLVISGNENKIDLISGAPRVIKPDAGDSLTILDYSKFPPTVQHLPDIPNTVIGPPSNIAITPDGSLALVADSLKIDPANPTNPIPETAIHVLDLTARPPQVIGQVQVGRQPSGISIASHGRLALVANRADGTVSVLAIKGREISVRQTVPVCLPAESASDVAISPDGRLALVSVQKGSHLVALELDGESVRTTGRKFSTCGQPYRVVITPDGELALTAGQGFGSGTDRDAVTVIDLKSRPMRTIDYVTVGAVPESIEISPDGKFLAVVLMEGSSLPVNDPNHRPNGELVLLERKGRTFVVVDRQPTGRIPEGVAFTSDGKYLVVQCHPDRELWTFTVRRGRLKDTGHRVKVPGMPSSLRASP